MNENKGKNIGSWFGNIANIVALLSIGIIIASLFCEEVDTVALCFAFAVLILVIFLRYADIARFRNGFSQPGAVPPLGLARGSVRALLAFTILVSFGLYIFFVIRKTIAFEDKVFTALIAIVSSVVGFYFGTRSSATAAEPAASASAPSIIGIEPNTAKAGSKVAAVNMAGTGFQADAIVTLVMGSETLLAQDVHIVRSTKIMCSFDLSSKGKPGKWNVVVTNPDHQTGILKEGFTIAN